MPSPREDPQMHMDEQAIYDPDLASAIDDYIGTRGEAAANRAAKRKIKRLMPQEQGRYRVGYYILEIQPMSGGGFEVKPWRSLVASIGTGSGE